MRRQFLETAGVAATVRSGSATGRRKQLYGLLGDLPARNRKVTARTVRTVDKGAYTLERLVLDLNGIEEAPAYFVKPQDMLWKGQVMWGMMVYDSLKAIDYLETRPDVDKTRMGTLGMSMGSTMAWWVAALDTRMKVCIDICCLTDFQSLIEANGLGGHGIYYYVPSLLKHFTASEINALICPRPHLGLAGDRDALTPVKGLERIDADMKAVYAKAGKPENWKLLRYDVAHEETTDMRREIMAFLKLHL
ncbi:MAG: acetylxylan esterase [Bryobacterales bacterium]|nr:acetylxylan esterase [Bryobacterales bacterium]